MGFDGTSLDDEYAYKGLTKYGVADGHVPMPSTEEVRKFREQFYGAEEAVTGFPIDSLTDDDQREKYAKRLVELSPDERDKIYVGNREAVIDFCNGTPTREQIESLPMPVQAGFIEWVRGLLAPLF